MSTPDDFWGHLHLGQPRTDPPPARPSPAQGLLHWASQLDETPILILEGPASERAEAYAWLRQNHTVVLGRDGWLGVGALGDFAFHVSRLGGDWSLLWGLCDVDDFVVDEPLREMIDQGSQYTELFRAIWEVRFLLDEGHDVRAYIEALARWTTEGEESDQLQRLRIRSRPNPRQRIDLLLFLLALAQQSNLLDAPPVFVFDGLDRALEQAAEPRRFLLRGLLEMIDAIEGWASLGSPAGVLVGLAQPKKTLRQLRRRNAKLHRKIQRHLSGV